MRADAAWLKPEKDGRSISRQHQEGLSPPGAQEEKDGRRGEEDQPPDHRRGRSGGAGLQPGHRGQGVHRAGGPLWLRQVHHTADDRGAGGDQRR